MIYYYLKWRVPYCLFNVEGFSVVSETSCLKVIKGKPSIYGCGMGKSAEERISQVSGFISLQSEIARSLLRKWLRELGLELKTHFLRRHATHKPCPRECLCLLATNIHNPFYYHKKDQFCV